MYKFFSRVVHDFFYHKPTRCKDKPVTRCVDSQQQQQQQTKCCFFSILDPDQLASSEAS